MRSVRYFRYSRGVDPRNRGFCSAVAIFFSFRERIFRSDLVDSASLGREDPRRWERFFSFRDRIFRSVLVHSPSVGREVPQGREVIFRAGKYFFVPGNNCSFPLVHLPSVGREVSQRREGIFRSGKEFFVPFRCLLLLWQRGIPLMGARSATNEKKILARSAAF